MKIEISHSHAKEIALDKMKNMFGDFKRQTGDKVQNITEEWIENKGNFSCQFNNIQLKGQIEVTDNKVILIGSLPMFALPFSSMIESIVKNEVEKTLR